jgi:hypothetical protein
MRTRNSIDIPRPSPPEDPSQGNYYTHWQDFHHLLKPANGLSGKATNSLVGDLVMQSLFLVVVLKNTKKKKKKKITKPNKNSNVMLLNPPTNQPGGHIIQDWCWPDFILN